MGDSVQTSQPITSDDTDVKTEYLEMSDPMYDKIENAIRETYTNSCIIWIEKIHNPQLKLEFNTYYKTLSEPNIKMLFHGTNSKIARIIISEGFDSSKNKVSAHGLGTYFSTRAVYSKQYCTKLKDEDYSLMLICAVATGKFCQGIANKPIPDGYDSAVDIVRKPDMYIVNKRCAALPTYLVAFYMNAT